MDDEALIQRARSGDRDAFSEIVRRYQDDLYTMALRMTGSPADAADVVQDTLLRAYLRIPELRGVSVRSWLFRVTVNGCHDVFRRKVRRPTDPLEDSEGNVVELPDPSIGPEAGALGRERATAIRAALLALPPDARAIIVLRDVNDLGYDEIAATLRIPLGTVKSRLSRARTQMAQLLRGHGDLFAAMGGEG